LGSDSGLAIDRTLCEMMGARLHLRSVLGEGAQAEVLLQVPEFEPQTAFLLWDAI